MLNRKLLINLKKCRYVKRQTCNYSDVQETRHHQSYRITEVIIRNHRDVIIIQMSKKLSINNHKTVPQNYTGEINPPSAIV